MKKFILLGQYAIANRKCGTNINFYVSIASLTKKLLNNLYIYKIATFEK